MTFSSRRIRTESGRTERGGRSFFRLVLVGFVVFGTLAWHVSSLGAVTVPRGTFIVTKGDSMNALPKKWKLDVADWRFKAYVRFFAPKIVNLQVGTYEIPSGSTVRSVFEKVLPSPNVKDLTVTFLPGWTLFDIDAYLASLGLVPEGAVRNLDPATFDRLSETYPFLKGRSSMEGYVYPDTYRIRPDAGVASILSKALSNFDAKIASKHADLGKDFYSTLILASIVEKEERNAKNRPIVAGVLAKRLDEGIPLGADATVCYAYSLVRKDCTPAFIAEHIQEKTEYNTRNAKGLPPTPIANPTAESFEAARFPEKSEYYYYLHDDEGQIHYGRTLEDHNRNKARYLGR